MELKTFDTILTEICDTFDTLISPKRITRSNTNIIYLMFKAIAKGFEVINNVCVVLSNKFDPANCSDEDLNSVASLVGTEKLKGSASGLNIIITNKGSETVTLLSGTYTYMLNEETKFSFDVLVDKEIAPETHVQYIAMSEVIGKFPVTEQTSIKVTSSVEIPEGLSFSCSDNKSLLGFEEESNLDFRSRILTDSTRQNGIIELQTALKNLPYIFDCKIKFNDTTSPFAFEGYTIPPYTALIMYSGEAKDEIAEKIAEKIVFPTVQAEGSVPVKYKNDVFVNGEHVYYINPFTKAGFTVDITLKVNQEYTSTEKAEDLIESSLITKFTSERHVDYVTEDDIYNAITSLNLVGVTLLSVNLYQGDEQVDYIEIPFTQVPSLTDVTFNEV